MTVGEVFEPPLAFGQGLIDGSEGFDHAHGGIQISDAVQRTGQHESIGRIAGSDADSAACLTERHRCIGLHE